MSKSVLTGAMEAPPRVTEWQRFRRVFFGRKIVVFGTAIIGLLVFAAIFAPWLAPYDPVKISLTERLQGPSWAHWLGTDNYGRDTLSRLIYGARTSLFVGLTSVGLASVVGMVLGGMAAYYGGWFGATVMRVMDALMALPVVVLALVVAALLGGGLWNVIFALSVSQVPEYARLMAGQVRSVKENDYITAVRSLGAKDSRIMFGHLFPNSFAPLIVQFTLQVGSTILGEAILSFLGIGITPPTAAWGAMISNARDYLLQQPIMSIVPGLAIMLTVFAFNMVGDGLRDALDPRLRGRL
ncbi:ABC transporter permease [Devosia sp.]|uniref:ABC transporter permease n=1 Tax=Devosia sp. TaxID=1871048 RepID=UPI00086D06BF|nr:ABC transporter permease [Devosia sp.]ODT83693.1 MAG: ABC transporter permease [Pelagibacterium sp. SCN 64-44]